MPKSFNRVGKTQNLLIMKKLDMNQMEELQGGISWGCGLALAGTLVATVGLGLATGGAGLAVALIGKGIAVASIGTSCAK